MFDLEDNRLSEYFGGADITINFDFLEKAITYQSIVEGVIEPNQFIKIVKLDADSENRCADFTCEVFNYLMN